MSFEAEINQKIHEKEALSGRLEISLLKYFWQVGPLAAGGKNTIPLFLRKVSILQDFSDNELRILANFCHLRNFNHGETIFRQGDQGVGFYLIYQGIVQIFVDDEEEENTEVEEKSERKKFVLSLEQFDYFGELALIQNNSLRSATMVAKDHVQLLGIFRPDYEELVQEYPIVAAKLLQSIALVVTKRLFSLIEEVKKWKIKAMNLERAINE